jgi:hypothetical protein
MTIPRAGDVGPSSVEAAMYELLWKQLGNKKMEACP